MFNLDNLCRVKVKKLTKTAQLPTRGSTQAAGWDLYADNAPDESWIISADNGTLVIAIPAHKTVKIGTGLAMAIEDGWKGVICPRSGIASKRSLRPANTPGTIDSDYRGEIIVALHNDSDQDEIVLPGERIAQICFEQVPVVTWKVVNELSETERGTGGFGSTGTK